MWLRIGGTSSDFLTFVPPAASNSTCGSDGDTEYESGEPIQYSGQEADMEISGSGANCQATPSRWDSISHRDRWTDAKTSPDTSDTLEMYPDEWDKMQEFARSVGWKVIFVLNVQLRDSWGQWNFTNAASLIEYSKEKGLSTA